MYSMHAVGNHARVWLPLPSATANSLEAEKDNIAFIKTLSNSLSHPQSKKSMFI